jgi:citrate lyase subunit beta/citryl-CoA lyase
VPSSRDDEPTPGADGERVVTMSDHFADSREPRPPRTSLRSRLYVPANKTAWIDKGVSSGADAIILDLDDAVPADEKDRARGDVVEAIERSASMPLFVRINDLSTRWALDDLEAVVRPGLFGIVAPRLTAVSQVIALDVMLSWLELRAGMPDGTVVLSPIFETATSMHFAYEFAAASSRVEYVGGIATDGGDVQRALGYRWSPSAWESLAMRAQCLVDVRAAGVVNPLTGIWTALDDDDGLRSFAMQGRDLGYIGMDVIHPTHVAVVHSAFSYDEDDVVRAQRIVELARSAETVAGAGGDERNVGALRFEGRMIDAAMVRTATELLRRANRL